MVTPVGLAAAIIQGGNIIPEGHPWPPASASFMVLTLLFGVITWMAEPLVRYFSICLESVPVLRKPTLEGVGNVFPRFPRGHVPFAALTRRAWRSVLERLLLYRALRDPNQRDVELDVGVSEG